MGKRSIIPLENDLIRLRLITRQDLLLTLHWRNQIDIRRWFFHSETLSMENHLRWFEVYQQLDDDYVFIIEEVQAEYRPVGQVAIYHINWAERRGEFGRLMIGEASAAGKGLALAATQLVLHLAFHDLGLQQVYLEVMSNNLRALSVYRRAGFVECGSDGQITRMSICESQT